jgi:NAD(P)-dependent dehydrogenase (short-subunit alcohol dehydrogenase family)
MGESLQGKVAVVTGSGRGIGQAIVKEMAAEGCKVVVNDLGANLDGTGTEGGPADQTVAEIKAAGGEAAPNTDNIATAEGSENLIKTAVDNFGRIDIVVNCAGILRDRMIHKMSWEDFDAVVKVHLYGTFGTIRAAMPYMREQGYGRIINFSSIGGGGGGPLGNPGQANYTAAKAGIIGLSRTVAMEGGRKGITCNVVFPAAKTRMGWSDDLEKAWDARASAGVVDATTVVLDKMKSGDLQPEDISPMVAYLGSDAAKMINGCVFHIMGREIRLYGEMMPERTIFSKGDRWTVEELQKIAPRLVTFGL